jgi:hypothetical protein
MPAKNNRPDARRDANEPEIVDALQELGYAVHRIGSPGDLLVWNHETRHWICLEVKVPGGRLTPKQKTYRQENPDIDLPIVENIEQAALAVYSR